MNEEPAEIVDSNPRFGFNAMWPGADCESLEVEACLGSECVTVFFRGDDEKHLLRYMLDRRKVPGWLSTAILSRPLALTPDGDPVP